MYQPHICKLQMCGWFLYDKNWGKIRVEKRKFR